MARNAAGWSNASAASEPAITAAPAAPLPPGAATCGVSTGSTVFLSWAPPARNGGEEVSYTVIAAVTNTSYPLSMPLAYDRDASAHAVTVTGLWSEASYLFQVVAFNSAGASPPVNASQLCETGKASKPSKPDPPKLSKATSDTILVTWKPPADTGGAPIMTYSLRADVLSGPYFGDTHSFAVQMTGVETGDIQYTITGLWASATYTVMVRAENAAGVSLWSWFSTAIPTGAATAPSAPAAATLVTSTGGTLTVTWDPPSDLGGAPITSYLVQLTSSVCCVPFWDSVLVSSGTSVTLPRLVAATNYVVRLRAVNVAGAGPYSAHSAQFSTGAATVPDDVADLAVATPLPSMATVSWRTPLDFGGSPVTKYTVRYRRGDLGFTTAAVMMVEEDGVGAAPGDIHGIASYSVNITQLSGGGKYVHMVETPARVRAHDVLHGLFAGTPCKLSPPTPLAMAVR